ncbi:hypothetical protein RMSM_05986 [Rhodopirellula maiorica SM1]|uniref:Uncharacterized protein n=1 Tax=Rhodopirellula maiorica SM1 TaxID=1265738 RepID=M5RDD8_9BACT|nr:hypothetical protein [Rhodopirellula maiorica]EMI17091.1 hypothetical protein RMSM_05986 [Rhodopirellula maiorica SM1]
MLDRSDVIRSQNEMTSLQSGILDQKLSSSVSIAGNQARWASPDGIENVSFQVVTDEFTEDAD